MRKYEALLKTLRHIVFVVTPISIALLSINLWPSEVNSRQGADYSGVEMERRHTEVLAREIMAEDVIVKNRTSAFGAVAIEKTDRGSFLVSLRNSYDRKITAIQVSIGKTVVTTDFIYHPNQMIQPGAVYLKELAIVPYTDTDGIGILGVVFDDGSGDGDPIFVKRIQAIRAGEKEQQERILNILQNTLDSKDVESPTALDKLQSEILSLPEDRGDGKRGNYEYGLHRQKEQMLSTLSSIRQRQSHRFQSRIERGTSQEQNVRQELIGVIELYIRQIAKN